MEFSSSRERKFGAIEEQRRVLVEKTKMGRESNDDDEEESKVNSIALTKMLKKCILFFVKIVKRESIVFLLLMKALCVMPNEKEDCEG